MDAIETDQIEKIVMARRMELEFTDAIDPWSLMRRWSETIADSYLWAIQIAPNNCFIGSSPERCTHCEMEWLNPRLSPAPGRAVRPSRRTWR